HTGAFRVAAARDRQALLDQVRIPEQLGRLRQAIESGRMDSPPLLNRVIEDLNRTEYPNQALAAVAREVIGAAEARKQRVGRDLTRLLEASPDVRRDVQRMFPQYVEPLRDGVQHYPR